MVLAGEVGGRLSEECREFLNQVRSQTGAPASAREGSPGVAAQMDASLGAARPKLLPFSAGAQERSGFMVTQVLRGPRPLTWPPAAQKRDITEIPNSKPVGSWRQQYVQTPVRERGPDPDTVQQDVRRRVVSLEAVLQAMGDFQGPEVDVMKNSKQPKHVH